MPRRNRNARQRKAPWFIAKYGDSPAPKQRKPIRAVSPKRAIANRIYATKRRKFLKANPFCAVYPTKKSTQVHHTKGRKGKNYLNESTWIAVSAKGHDRIHQIMPGLENLSGPAWATRMGYLKSFHV